jgi:hypothetical protein
MVAASIPSWDSGKGTRAQPPKPLSQGITLLRLQPARDLAHDRNDFLHDITADAAGSTSQQILDRSADLCFGVVRASKFPIVLI